MICSRSHAFIAAIFHPSNLTSTPPSPHSQPPLFSSSVCPLPLSPSLSLPYFILPSSLLSSALSCVLTCVLLLFFSSLPSLSSPDGTVCRVSPPLTVSAALHSQTGSQPYHWDTHFGAAERTTADVCVFVLTRACAGTVCFLCISLLKCRS